MNEFEDFFNLSLDPLIIADFNGHILHVNRAFQSAFGWTKADLQTIDYENLVHPDDLPKMEVMRKTLERGHPILSIEFRHVCKNGEFKPVIFTIRPLPKKGLQYIIGRLASEQVFPYSLMLETVSVPALIVKPNGRIEKANALAESLLGYEAGELEGLPVDRLIPDRFRTTHATHRQTYHNAPEARPMGIRNDLTALHRSGREIHVSIALNPLRSQKETLALVSILDLTSQDHLEQETRDLLRENERLVELSQIDPLTQTFNRRGMEEHFLDILQAGIVSQSRVAVILLDIDHFKLFNDTHGHQAGDSLLNQVANILRRNVREHDVLARYGGEEFIIVMPQCDMSRGVEVAERIRLMVRDQHSFDHPVSISLGVSAYAFRGKTLPAEKVMKMLIHQADHALYSAKLAGRNRTKQFKESS